MTSHETYTAELRDRVFGPVVARLHGQRLVDRRPDKVVRLSVEHEGREWVKVYDLEPEGGDPHRYSYLLSYEGPSPDGETLEETKTR